MSEFDKYLCCDAMGGKEDCCGILEWKADGRVICSECGMEFDVKPILKKVLDGAFNETN